MAKKHSASFISICLLVFLVSACSSVGLGEAPTATPPREVQAQVVRVIDGDTIDVNINGDEFRLRYIGINTPEQSEPCYAEATQANRDLVEGKTVRLVKDTSEVDPFGRMLRYVYVGNVFVNRQLVQDGFAEAVRYEPDTLYFSTFVNFERAASAASKGCHPTLIFNDRTFER